MLSMQWEKVSEDLGGSRSALECLARSQYLRKLKGGSKAWSPQEVEVLKESYARHVCRGSFWKVNAPDWSNFIEGSQKYLQRANCY